MIQFIIKNNETIKDAVDALKEIDLLSYKIFIEYEYLGPGLYSPEEPIDIDYIEMYKLFISSWIESVEQLNIFMYAFKNELMKMGYSDEDIDEIVLASLAVKLRANTRC